MRKIDAASGFIDAWDIRTFDDEFRAAFENAADLVRDYLTARHEIDRFMDGYKGCEPRRENPHAEEFAALREIIAALLESRTIRGWHYARLTDSEAENVRHEGIHLSTPRALRARLDAVVESGQLSAQQAEVLYAASPFHQQPSRANTFHLISHPQAIDDGGVQPLLGRWGGEVASMFLPDEALIAIISRIGKPRVVEIAVPLAATRRGCSGAAAEAVLATFAGSLGFRPLGHGFNLVVVAPLGPDAVLALHTEGDQSFRAMGRDYPKEYANFWRAVIEET